MERTSRKKENIRLLTGREINFDIQNPWRNRNNSNLKELKKSVILKLNVKLLFKINPQKQNKVNELDNNENTNQNSKKDLLRETTEEIQNQRFDIVLLEHIYSLKNAKMTSMAFCNTFGKMFFGYTHGKVRKL